MNDKVFKNLENIYSAIASNSQITFQYLHWNPQRELVSKKGKIYLVSPYAVTLTDDNYYLISFDSNAKELRHYRIDKMQSVKSTGEAREGQTLFQSFDIVDYSRKTFGMFGGKEEIVTIESANSLAGVFIDGFGEAASIRPNYNNPDSFIVCHRPCQSSIFCLDIWTWKSRQNHITRISSNRFQRNDRKHTKELSFLTFMNKTKFLCYRFSYFICS